MSCEKRLHEAYAFTQLCETNDKILRKILAKHKNEELLGNISDDSFNPALPELDKHSIDEIDDTSNTDIKNVSSINAKNETSLKVDTNELEGMENV